MQQQPTINSTTVALVIVDMQEDYLNSPNLTPNRTEVIASTSELLTAARAAGSFVAHVQTLVNVDATNAMPHRKSNPRCVVGTPGASPPPQLAPQTGEKVITKQYFSAFENDEFDSWLQRNGVTDIELAGAYTHACVRQTALDAYQRGYSVHIVRDGVCSDQPEHAALTLDWVGARAASIISVQDAAQLFVEHEPELLDKSLSRKPNIDQLLMSMSQAQFQWSATSLEHRSAVLLRWAEELENVSETLVSLLVDEIGKPVVAARDEVNRAIAHIRVSVNPQVSQALWGEAITSKIRVERRPIGLVASILPWNNPVALAVGTIAPALFAGNGVAWKPSPLASRVSKAVLSTLDQVDVPQRLVAIVEGGKETAMQLVHHPMINGVTLTGSIEAGKAISIACSKLFKPFRGELGGNNAAIVLADADIAAVVPELLRNAFMFAGQRCTAIRRFVVHEEIADQFIEEALNTLPNVIVGSPLNEDTVCGPLISPQAVDRVLNELSAAVGEGATLLTGGTPVLLDQRPGIEPALVLVEEPSHQLVQRETFGPVVVIQVADSLDHAIELANGVDQGLVMSVCTSSDVAFREISRRANVGMVQRGGSPVPVHPEAPFVGWKHSSVGLPEHGRWDVDFFTQPQTHYS